MCLEAEVCIMNINSVVEAVRRNFGFLAERGALEIVAPSEFAEDAAGWTIEVVSEALRLKLILDRGQVFVDVGSSLDDGRWYDLSLLISFLTEEKHRFGYSVPEGPVSDEAVELQIERGARAVRDNYARLARFFDEEGFETRESALVAYRKEKSDKRWNRLLR